MIRDITIGQYYASDSVIHRLDPRIKIMGTLLFIISLFFVKTIYIYPYVILMLMILIKLTKVPPFFMLKGLKSILFVILFTVGLNIFMTPGDHLLFKAGIFKITSEGLLAAALGGTRIIVLVISSSILTLTTSPIELTDGLEYLLKPLKKIGVPAHEIAMMMTIALRFIPILLEETDKIMKAQQARGVDFETGTLMKRAKNLVPILVPLFISAIRRAEDLAQAMESRCYHGDENRTKMKVMALQKCDFSALIIMIIYVTFLLFLIKKI